MKPLAKPSDSSSVSPEVFTIKKIGVVGAGAMGRGIVQLFAQCGFQVSVFDSGPGAVDAAIASLQQTFNALQEKGKLSAQQAERNFANCIAARNLGDLASCDLVVEAIVERLEVKQGLFKQLEELLSPSALIATNTSSLSVTALAKGMEQPKRLAGLHFFNPVPLMKVVEVVRGAHTDNRYIAALSQLVTASGHRPVVCIDAPGFIVNHAGRGFSTESIRCVSEGVADFATVDAILREQVQFPNAGGFKLGPFELMDLTGLDVSHAVMESIYQQFYDEPRFRPTFLTAQRVSAGLYGRKTQAGFYQYEQGKKLVSALTPQATSSWNNPVSVWIAPSQESDGLAALFSGLGASLNPVDEPSPQDIIVLAPLGADCSYALSELAQALDISVAALNPQRVVAIDTLFPYGLRACKRRVVMGSPATNKETLTTMTALLAQDGAAVSCIKDSAGFVAQRVVCMIVAIACEIAQQQIASPLDINDAVRLGLGYPLGPLAMGDSLQAEKVLTCMNGILGVTQDPRYRPSLWLQRRALLGLSLLTEAA
jgi:3-hydroxybutyryl-CoA dehydrogenase